MTSVYRLGHRTSDHREETVRIGLTEAEAETLGMILGHIGGSNGNGGAPSRRVHVDRIVEGLVGIGVLTLDEEHCTISGLMSFTPDDNFNHGLLFEGEGVKFL